MLSKRSYDLQKKARFAGKASSTGGMTSSISLLIWPLVQLSRDCCRYHRTDTTNIALISFFVHSSQPTLTLLAARTWFWICLQLAPYQIKPLAATRYGKHACVPTWPAFLIKKHFRYRFSILFCKLHWTLYGSTFTQSVLQLAIWYSLYDFTYSTTLCRICLDISSRLSLPVSSLPVSLRVRASATPSVDIEKIFNLKNRKTSSAY